MILSSIDNYQKTNRWSKALSDSDIQSVTPVTANYLELLPTRDKKGNKKKTGTTVLIIK